MLFKAFHRALLISTLVALPLSAEAADGRYGAWSPPGANSSSPAGNTEDLLKDLKALVDDAEKAKAADRLFLRDLRDLMARYENPWIKRALFDDFMDGELAKNPSWKTVSGEFWVERGYGLRSKAVAGSVGSTSSGKMSKEELAISILGAVLQGKNKSSTQTQTKPTPATPAVLSTRATISNAFALNAEFSSWKGEGDFAFAVTQGSGGAGYRLVYTPKQSGRSATVELVRKSSRGEGVINSHSIDALEDQKTHALAWTRDKLGNMTVSVDGKQVMSARDASFRDAFDGAAIINAGADVIVKSVEVLGM
ncbi:hypothetical protein V5T82_00965 [Magnetovibrio sp. PR-2]|uniref:hypothetical protein n=1 Tax=Magnetovibrio sp. PR-2 TaxID=3120356 RepID=UPI002FCE14D8